MASLDDRSSHLRIFEVVCSEAWVPAFWHARDTALTDTPIKGAGDKAPQAHAEGLASVSGHVESTKQSGVHRPCGRCDFRSRAVVLRIEVGQASTQILRRWPSTCGAAAEDGGADGRS